MKPFRLALVTGATSGIGEALCRLLAKQGIDLLITGRNQDNLQNLAEELRSMVQVTIHPADLGNKEQRQLLIKKMNELSPDLVINNAGFGLYGEALSYTTADQAEIVNIDVNAVLDIALEAARHMVAHEIKGVILNVSSAAGFLPFPYFSVYAASKAFVNSFSEGFDEEVKDHGVRVLAACPGRVATHFQRRASGGKFAKDHAKFMTSEFAAEQIWKQIQARKPVQIFNWKYRFTIFLATYCIPNFILKPLLKAGLAKNAPPRPLIK